MKRTTKNAATTEPKYVIPESEQLWKSRCHQTLLIKSLSKLFPFAELSVIEVAFPLRIPRRWVLSTCTFDGQLPFKMTTAPGFEDLVQEERDQEGHNRDDGGQEEPRTRVKMLRVSSHVQEARSCSDMPVVVQAFHYHLLNEKEE